MKNIKTTSMYEYAVRIDEKHDGGDKIKFLSIFEFLNPSKLIISQEISKEIKKVHYHAYVMIDLKIKDLRNKIDYQFKDHKKGSKSLAICKNPESYLAYMTKDADVIHRQGFTDADFEAIKKWQSKPEFKQNMVETLHRYVGNKKDLADITDAILQWYDENNRPFMKHLLKSYAYALYYKNNNRDPDVKRSIREFILS